MKFGSVLGCKIFFNAYICKAVSVSSIYCNKMSNSCSMASQSMWPKVILFGDSLTQFSFSDDGCWGSLLADKLQRRCDVLNRGFSGYNARWNKIILPKILKKEDAKAVVAFIIFLGANDSVIQDLNPAQHVPRNEYKENLGQMIDYLESIGVSREKIILIGPPPCVESKWAVETKIKGKPMSKDNVQTGKYAEACQEVSSQSGVEFLDLYTSMMKDQDWERYLRDGLHLSKDGSHFVFNKLWPLVERRTGHLPYSIFPYWADIDPNNPDASL